MDKEYLNVRDKAISWLNSRGRNFAEGLVILQESKYKPIAVSKVAKWGETNKFAKDKLLSLMYEFVGKWINPNDQKHTDELPDPDDISNENTIPEEKDVEKICDDQGYPDIVRRVIHAFYALSKERSVLHKEASELDGNSAEVVLKRNNILNSVEAISERMDTLWKAKVLWEKDGTIPGDELFSADSLDEKNTNKEVKSDYEIPENSSLDDLKKLKKNITSKLVKAKNMLEFQAETRQDKPSPMPEGPKRAKQEKRIQNFSDQLEKIEYRIIELS